MNRYQIFFTISVLIAGVLLSACTSAPLITMQDIPMHPKSGESSSDNSHAAKPSQDKYSKYETTGTSVYYIWNKDLQELSIDDFYKKELPALGWEFIETENYLDVRFNGFCASNSWEKNIQIILIVTCPHPSQDATVLSVVLLTK